MAEDFRNTKTFDLFAASPFLVYYSFAVVGICARIVSRLASPLDFAGALDIASQATTMVFLGVQIALFLLRRLPAAKAPGPMPRIAAVIGANLSVLFLAIPRADIAPWLAATSTAITLVGTAGAIVSASWLGRSFAILPQARGLVVSGPYRYVRHPVYLFEQIATFGAMLQFRQPLGVILALVVLAAQFPRMHFEEEILDETFPEYAQYRARTARFIPGVY